MERFELKPCPFCGGEAKTKIGLTRWDATIAEARLTAFCNDCGCYRSVTLEFKDTEFNKVLIAMDKTVELWNRRFEK